jgi:hypothetical protein
MEIFFFLQNRRERDISQFSYEDRKKLLKMELTKMNAFSFQKLKP